MFRLETERLYLRPLEIGDYEAVHSYASDKEVSRYVTFGPNTPEETKKYLKECNIGWHLTPLRKHDCGIILKETDRLIGAVGIYLDETLRQGMMGWLLHPDYQGKGYMTEAAKELMRYGFEELSLHRIYANCFEPNTPSWAVMERLGMRREGRLIEARQLKFVEPESWCDELHYAILEKEWKAKRNA